MPYHPQRFIHAANVRLDVPVSVYLSEKLTEELRHQLEDATLLSFSCVIDHCVSRKVDYLLLSGNLFVEADRSLRARLALLKGFRRLQQHDIPVFVLPGDTDPQEAWRAIPELPENVHVCYSSNPEPHSLERGTRTIATVTASMWYGETDAFGIRVIPTSPDGIEPFRIGTVSRAKYDESRRMADLTTAAEDTLISLEDETSETPTPTVVTDGDPAEDYESGFRQYMRKLMREGRLDYLALASELQRDTLALDTGLVHCPGTTQPRSQLESHSGLCSLMTVSTGGQVTCEEINSSAVDWKEISLTLRPGMELNLLLEEMRDVLLDTPRSTSDRIWSVCWTLTGPLPVLRQFEEEDVELAVAVELDQLNPDGHPIRLLHQVRLLPDGWELDDPIHLAQQYADQMPDTDALTRDQLTGLLDSDLLTEGWTRRLESLADGIDPQRLMAQLRNDGADWFVSDPDELLPDSATAADTTETLAVAIPDSDELVDELLTDQSLVTDHEDDIETSADSSADS